MGSWRWSPPEPAGSPTALGRTGREPFRCAGPAHNQRRSRPYPKSPDRSGSVDRTDRNHVVLPCFGQSADSSATSSLTAVALDQPGGAVSAAPFAPAADNIDGRRTGGDLGERRHPRSKPEEQRENKRRRPPLDFLPGPIGRSAALSVSTNPGPQPGVLKARSLAD